MSDFSALNAAVTGLNAHRRRIDIISQNIVNAETPGYHRQVTELRAVESGQPGLFTGSPGEYGGVESSVSRRWDQILDTNAKKEGGRAASLEAQAEAMRAIEQNIGAFGDTGLAGRLQQMFNSFDDLANDPSDLAVRNVVLGNAETVASALNLEGAAIDTAHQGAAERAKALVQQLNGLASSIAELDRSIVAGVASGDDPHGLIDQRDRLATELTGLVNVELSYENDGQIRLSLNGHNLVSDGQSRPVTLASTPDPTLAPFGYQRLSLQSGSGRNLELRAGSIHGVLTVANELAPQQRAALDAVAADIVTTVNALHSTGTGLDGSTGNNLFDPAGVTALTFAVSADVAGQPRRLAASDGSGALDNSVALGIAALATDPNGPSANHAQMLTDLGNRVRLLTNSADTAALASGRANKALQAEVGVSLDEELADLVSAQRAYEASARMISAIDEMLDTLINRTGLVGR